MSTLASLIILCAIAIGSLLLVSIVNQRQAKAKHARQRFNYLKHRVDAIEELALALDQLVEHRIITQLVYSEAVGFLNTMSKLDPSANYLEAVSAHAHERALQFADHEGQRSILRLKENDTQVKAAQHVLTEAARVLRQQHSKDLIEAKALERYLQELRWLHLYVEVISLIGRGMVLMAREDVMGAFALYKRAQGRLLDSDHPDPRRTALVKELNEMLGKRRDQPSPDLMPEAAGIAREIAKFASKKEQDASQMDDEIELNDSSVAP